MMAAGGLLTVLSPEVRARFLDRVPPHHSRAFRARRITGNSRARAYNVLGHRHQESRSFASRRRWQPSTPANPVNPAGGIAWALPIQPSTTTSKACCS
jgi:hypothetical protein